jgi:hypothetical protein
LVHPGACGILRHPAAKELQLYQRSAIGQSASDLVRTHGLTSEASGYVWMASWGEAMEKPNRFAMTK